jgi:hypothetical protein
MGQAFDRAAVLALTPEPARAEADAHLLALVRKELLRPAQAPFGGRDGFSSATSWSATPPTTHCPSRPGPSCTSATPTGWPRPRGPRRRGLRGAGLAPGARLPVPDRARPGRRPRPEVAAAAAASWPRPAAPPPAAATCRPPPTCWNGPSRLLPATDRARLELLTDLGEVLILNVETERARRVLDEALAAAERTGDHGLAAHATLGKLELRLDSPDRGPDRYRADVQEALSVLEGLGDEQGQSRAWRLLGWTATCAARSAGPRTSSSGRSPTPGRRRRRVEAANLYALVQAAYWGPTPVAEGIRRCQEIRDRAEGSYRVEMSALHTLAGLHAMAGEFDRARELGAAAVQIAGKLGPTGSPPCAASPRPGELLAGDPAAAARWLRWGAGILERIGERGLRSELTANLARALTAQGQDDEALEQANLSGELAVRDDLYAQVERRGPLALVLARRGRPAEAERVATEAVELPPTATCWGCRPAPCSTWPGCCGWPAGTRRRRRWPARPWPWPSARATWSPPPRPQRSSREGRRRLDSHRGAGRAVFRGDAGGAAARRAAAGAAARKGARGGRGAGAARDVERLRRATIALRTADGGRRQARAQVVELVAGFDLDRAELVARAFTVYFQLVNLAEEQHRVRTLRERRQHGGQVRESFAAAVQQVRDGPARTAWPTCWTGSRWCPCSPPTRPRPDAGPWSTPCAASPSSCCAWTPPGCPATTRPPPPGGCWRRSPPVAHRPAAARPAEPAGRGPLGHGRVRRHPVPAGAGHLPGLEQALAGGASGTGPPPFRPYLRWGSWVGGDRDGNPA